MFNFIIDPLLALAYSNEDTETNLLNLLLIQTILSIVCHALSAQLFLKNEALLQLQIRFLFLKNKALLHLIIQKIQLIRLHIDSPCVIL